MAIYYVSDDPTMQRYITVWF